jgi:DeoR/GlpR family transcriptional regulator of sugar metabolism
VLAAERRLKILEFMAGKQVVTVAESAARFGVSEVTIRKDLERLEAQGYLRRIHGGAVMAAGHDVALSIRYQKHRAEKTRIAAYAATLSAPGETVILDSGTTTALLASHLTALSKVTVVTNSVQIANDLAAREIDVVMIGGAVRPSTFSCVGQLTERALREFNAARTFLAINGVSAERGLTNANLQEVPVKQAMIRAGRQVILLADSSKLGQLSLALVAPIEAVHLVVTDRAAPESEVAAIRSRGVEVVTV